MGRCCHHLQSSAPGHTWGQGPLKGESSPDTTGKEGSPVSSSPKDVCPSHRCGLSYRPGPSDDAHTRVGLAGGGPGSPGRAAGPRGGARHGLPIACSADSPSRRLPEQSTRSSNGPDLQPRSQRINRGSWTNCINLNEASTQVAQDQVWSDASSRKCTTRGQRRQQCRGGGHCRLPTEPTLWAHELAWREREPVHSHGGPTPQRGPRGGPGRGRTTTSLGLGFSVANPSRPHFPLLLPWPLAPPVWVWSVHRGMAEQAAGDTDRGTDEHSPPVMTTGPLLGDGSFRGSREPTQQKPLYQGRTGRNVGPRCCGGGAGDPSSRYRPSPGPHSWAARPCPAGYSTIHMGSEWPPTRPGHVRLEGREASGGPG